MAEYRKVGRGGAGNYYSKQDIEAASKRAAEQRDLEAQSTRRSDQVERNNAPLPKYATSGRGGAGNLVNPSDLAPPVQDNIDAKTTFEENAAPVRGYSGRGGAGNFRDSSVIEGQVPQETELKEMRQSDTFQDAEAGLQQPQQAHLGGEKLRNDD